MTDSGGYAIETGRHDADNSTQTMPTNPVQPPSYDQQIGELPVSGVANPRTVIVLLNWNGAQDSMECIRSLLHLNDQNFLIVLCDNDSADGSFEQLLQWGAGELPGLCATWTPGQPVPPAAKLILIQTGANLGFAGGCNVGLRYALLHTTADFIWLLNNDTLVDPHALTYQLEAMQKRPHAGILGSTLIYCQPPYSMQAAGGYNFNFWTARVLPLTTESTPSQLPREDEVERQLRYVSGASMFVRRDFVQTVGLLNEQYFLYFEEVDWAVRGKGRFGLGYASQSLVWHKEGKSIGSHSSLTQRSAFSEEYLARNRVLFMKTYFPARLAVCLLWLAFVGLGRIVRGQGQLAFILWKGTARGLIAPVRSLPLVDVWPESMQRSG